MRKEAVPRHCLAESLSVADETKEEATSEGDGGESGRSYTCVCAELQSLILEMIVFFPFYVRIGNC